MKKWKEIIAGIGKDKLLLLAIAGILLLLCSVPDKKEENTPMLFKLRTVFFMYGTI